MGLGPNKSECETVKIKKKKKSYSNIKDGNKLLTYYNIQRNFLVFKFKLTYTECKTFKFKKHY